MDLLSYFGKLIPIGEKVTLTGYQFNYMMTLGIAACVIFLGHWMVRHSKFLQKYCIPAPVVAGLVVSIILSIVRGMHIVNITFDMTNIQDLSQNIFFMCVGYGFSAKLLKKAGGKLTAMIAIAACLLITLQNVVGLVVGHFIGLDPLLSLLCSSASMSGGVGKPWGVVVGCLLITVIANGLDIMGVSSHWQRIVKGAIIVLAVLIDIKGKSKKN